MVEPGLCFVDLEAASDEAAIRALAQALFASGKVKASFEAAAVSREKRSPTGLPFAGGAVALPHAEPEHVDSPALAIARLARAVSFREMGNPGVRLAVTLVVMPALTAKEQAAAGLASVLALLQDDGLRDEVRAAGGPDELCEAFRRRWTRR